MSRVIRRRWISSHEGPSRKDNRGCEYEAYVPDPLVGRNFTIDGQVAADIADAEAAIARPNVEATSLVDTEALARILHRAESVASSRIEGLEIGARRLLRAEAARVLGDDPSDVTAVEVLGNIDAMVYGIDAVGPGDPVTVEMLLEIHRRLLFGTRLEEYGGRFREKQNWIGGSAYNPCSAAFVPAPPEFVEGLIADLVAFANEDSLPAVAQSAIAQFRADSSWKYLQLCCEPEHGASDQCDVCFGRRIFPAHFAASLPHLATWAPGLHRRIDGQPVPRGPATSKEASEGINLWIGRFATACKRAVDDATSFEQQARTIEASWRERLGRVRARSAADLLLGVLIGAPVVTVNSAAEMVGRSFIQTNEAIQRLVDAGILKQVTVGRRNRAFEAPEIVAAFTALERQLASPEGDTRTSEPVRTVPRSK